MKVCILGNGSWGTALGQLLVDNDNEVIMWGIEKCLTTEINTKHTNTKYFPESVILPEKLISTDDLSLAVKDADAIVFAVPTIAISDVASKVNKLLNKKVYIINVSKGFNPIDDKRISETLRSVLNSKYIYPIVSLIGPSHAEEVILRKLTLITSTCTDEKTAQVIQKLFSNQYFRVYTNTDEIGAEYAAAIKNTIAIAAGCLVGLGYGDNAKAALVTRGLAEMARLGMKVGGQLTTYAGLTGLGDLMVTCNSIHSRNFMAGYEIGKTKDPKTFLLNNKKTVEGIRTCKVIHEISEKLNVEMPICEGVYKVLYEYQDPETVINELMQRELKKE